MRYIIFTGLIAFFIGSALYNFKLKRLIEVKQVVERTRVLALGALLVALLIMAYRVEGTFLTYLLVLSGWVLILSLSLVGGLNQEEIFYFGGWKPVLSRKKLEDLRYINVVFIGRNRIAKTMVRGNLLKRYMFFEERYLTRVEKFLRAKGARYYGRYENPEEKY